TVSPGTGPHAIGAPVADPQHLRTQWPGFARVSSHPLLGYDMSPHQAFGVLRRFISDSRHRFVPDDLSCEDRVVRTDLLGGASQASGLIMGNQAHNELRHAGPMTQDNP